MTPAVRWHNRLAAWICEHLHDLAVPAWTGHESTDEWADDEAERWAAVEESAYWHGYEKAMEEAAPEAEREAHW